jgi:hypothetical protein
MRHVKLAASPEPPTFIMAMAVSIFAYNVEKKEEREVN